MCRPGIVAGGCKLAVLTALVQRQGSPRRPPRLARPAQVLIEVAQSVLHLHNMKLLHCDIKPENVLLKSDSTNPLGFVTKLSDFGLAKLLREVRLLACPCSPVHGRPEPALACGYRQLCTTCMNVHRGPP